MKWRSWVSEQNVEDIIFRGRVRTVWGERVGE